MVSTASRSPLGHAITAALAHRSGHHAFVGTDWDDVKAFVEPIVAEINQPDAGPLMRCQIVIEGDGQEAVDVTFLYSAQTRERNAALLRYAARLLEGTARRTETPPPHGAP